LAGSLREHDMTAPVVGFVGLGAMGQPMVRQLLAHDFVVVGANRSQPIVETLAAEGMVPACDAREVAERSDVVLCALPDVATVKTVAQMIADVGREGQIVIEHSTVSPQIAQDHAALFAPVGIRFLDAPVSGGPAGAIAGTLTVMVGGEETTLNDARDVLAAFGNPIRHCGPVGAGQAVKLINQLLVGVHTAVSAEAAALGSSLGVDETLLAEVIGTSFGASTMLLRNLPRFKASDFTPATPVRLLEKDLGLVGDEGKAAGVSLPLTTVAAQLFSEAASKGLRDDDMAVLIELWRRNKS